MADIRIGCIELGVCQTNCYYLWREGREEALIIDPSDQGKCLYDTLREKGLRIAAILLTHGHFDHIWGCEELRSLSGARVYACEAEKALLSDPELNVSAAMGRPCALQPDVCLRDGEELTLADITLRVIATPGHTEGGCCYYLEKEHLVLSGDTLFQESVGRTDFPTGSMSRLIRSIKEKLLPLPEDVKVYPGHGAATTIGFEKKYNPFL